MGCTNSVPSASLPTTASVLSTTNINEFILVAEQVKQTWPDVQKIPKLDVKVFAHLVQKSPDLKSFYHIPEAYKTEAELLNADEIKEPAENLFKIYSDIIENFDTNYSNILHEKAIQLNNQGIRATQVKNYSESLFHVIKYELQDELNIDEKQSWASFTKQLSTQIALELSKFPRKSIV